MTGLQSYHKAAGNASEHQPSTLTHCQYKRKDHRGYVRPTGYVIQRPYSVSGNKHYFVFLFLQMSLRSSVLKRHNKTYVLYNNT